MIVGVVQTKGGPGKTTIALNLAIARAIEGRKVWFVDCDHPQQSASNALAIRAEVGNLATISVGSFRSGALLREQIRHNKDNYDDIVIDCGGFVSELLLATLCICDVGVAPFRPRAFDLWGLEDLNVVVSQARSMRDNLRMVSVMNMADSSGKDNLEAEQMAREIEGIEYLDTPLGDRKAFATAAASGRSIFEYTPSDAKARIEMRAFIEAVFGE